MIVLNFTHPLTSGQLSQVEALAGRAPESVVEIKTQFNSEQPFGEQMQSLIASTGLSAEEWQTRPLLINLPSLNVIAALLLAELHGRCGYFPAILRLRPLAGSAPPQFEVAEIINLQLVRDTARTHR